jgi:hypothetical protein
MKVEEDIEVIEEIFTAINKGADIGIKQEDIPQDITFPDIKAEPDEVSYVCACMSVCFYTHFTIVHKCFFSDVIISGQLKQLHCWE